VILLDDVLYTGRTIRAVLNELFDYGRPASVRWRCWWTAAGASCRCRPTLPPRASRCRPAQSLALARDDGRFSFKVEGA
jgi:pyrimidine operon attenuation protein/uracil phosphoribosyltransferase